MNLVRRVMKLETMSGKKSRRFLVRFENPETDLLEPAHVDEDDYTKVFDVRIVKPVATEQLVRKAQAAIAT